jgi:regulatory protein PHO2
MIHEDGRKYFDAIFQDLITDISLDLTAVTIIPCTDLTIGTWRRVSSGENTHDLVAYVCDAKRCLNWFIHSNGYGFKMEIPFNTIADTEFELLEDRTALTCFILSHPPIFYLETVSSPLVDKPAVRTWKRCSDWTEGHQASHILRHTVVGSETHLANVLRSLHSSAGALNMGSAHRPNRVMASPMELQPPPLAALTRDGPSYQDTDMKPADADIRRGSLYSTPNDRLPHDRSDLRPPPHSAPAASFPRDSLMRPHAHYDSGMYNGYTSTVQQRPDSSGYSAVPAGLAMYSRPYPTQPQPYFHNLPPPPRMLQPFQAEVPRAARPVAFHTPSPPLMTPNYDSNMNRDRHLPNPHYESPQPMHGMPGMMYEVVENNMHSR